MSNEIISTEHIAQRVFILRGEKVMLSQHLAILYGVSVGQLPQAVKRNALRFPKDFAYQLTPQEFAALKSQIVISKQGRGGGRHRPYAFTEQGVAMLSSVLKSERAVNVNIAIMRAFVKLRQTIETNHELARKFSELEKHVGQHDKDIGAIIDAIRRLMAPPEKPARKIGFHVQETAPRYRTCKGR